MSVHLLSLHHGTTVLDHQGLLTVRHRWGTTTIGPHTPPLAAALRTLAHGPASLDELAEQIRAAATPAGMPPEPLLALLWHAVEQLGHTLLRHVMAAAQTLATAVPLAPEAAPGQGPAPDVPVVLARAAHLRPADGRLVLESPQSGFRIRIDDDRAAAALACLARPVTAAELRRSVRALPADSVDAFLALLRATGFLHTADDATRAAAELPAGWSFHELLAFHGSRAGHRDRLYGPVYPLRGSRPPEPPVAPARPGRTILLHRPDLDRVALEDHSFTDVLEGRASRRRYGEHPLSVAELGEYLYRAARVRTLLDASPEQGRPYAVTSRPYPSAGSAHELELYLAVHRCDGLDRGLYHYDPLRHTLTALPGGPDAVDGLLHEASAATGGAPHPDIHLTVVSRITRLSWKYAAHAYALTLKNSGVLLQTLYLVGTAMGLSVCALGGGDSDTPVHAFDLAPYDEIPVGAFVIGSAPTAL